MDVKSSYMDPLRPALFSGNEGAAVSRGIFDPPGETTSRYTVILQPNRRVAATLISLLAIGSVFATPAVAQDLQLHQHPSSIRGTVINALTNEPISRALVFTSANRFARITDSE